MLIDLSKLTDPSYLLDPNPPYQFSGFWPLLGLFVFLFIAALLVTFFSWRPWHQPIPKRLTTPLWVAASGGLLLLFCRYQSIPYLSARALLFAFTLVSLLWIAYSLSVMRRELMLEREAEDKIERMRKYLPRKKQ